MDNTLKVHVTLNGETVYRETIDVPTYTGALRIIHKIKLLLRW